MANISALLEDPKVLEAALNGDEEVHNQLYKEVEAFIHQQKNIWVAKLFYGDPNMNDEVLAEIHVAYIKALRKFNPQKATFLTFFTTCLNNQMLMYYRTHLQKLKGIYIDSLDREIVQDDGSSTSLGNFIPVEEDKLENIFYEELCHEVKNLKLTNQKYPNLILLKLQGFTQRELVERLGITQSYVSRVYRAQVKALIKVLRSKGMYSSELIKLKQKPTQWTEEEIKLMCDMKISLTNRQIGKQFGVSANAIALVVSKYNKKKKV